MRTGLDRSFGEGEAGASKSGMPEGLSMSSAALFIRVDSCPFVVSTASFRLSAPPRVRYPHSVVALARPETQSPSPDEWRSSSRSTPPPPALRARQCTCPATVQTRCRTALRVPDRQPRAPDPRALDQQ